MYKVLSVIVPSYNMELLLPKGIDSLLCAELCRDRIQIIIVNDGSKDRTSEIAHSYQSTYPETVVVIDKENGNYGSCINAALPVANGRFVKIMDADDWYESDNMSEYIKFLEDNSSSDVVFNDFDFVDGVGNVKKIARFTCLSKRSNASISSLPDCFCKDVEMQAVAYNVNVFKGLGYHQTEGISYTDQEWMFQPMSRVCTYSYFPKVVYKYYVGREGQTISRDAILRNRWMVIRIVLGLMDIYARLQSNGVAASGYLRHRLLRKIEMVYSLLLLEPERYEKMDELRSLERDLKEKLPDIYSSCEFFCTPNALKFNYVAEWRRRQSEDSLRFKAYRLLCAAKRKIAKYI